MTIVSHRLRLIFLRTRKTAGTSIQEWLMPYLGPADVIAADPDFWPLAQPFLSTPSPVTRWFTAERGLKRFVLSHFGWRHLRLHHHEKATVVREVVGKDVWNGYRKVAVVRNPWDQVTSAWRFQQRLIGETFPLNGLLDAIEVDDERSPYFIRPDWPVYTIDDEVVADTIIRFERLQEDMTHLASEIGIPLHLPKRKVNGAIAAALTETEIARIAQLRRHEIETFDYLPPQPVQVGKP